VCDLETSRIGAPYIYNVRLLRVKQKLLEDGTPVPKHVSDTLLSEIHMVMSPHSLFGLNLLLAFRHYYRTNYNGIH